MESYDILVILLSVALFVSLALWIAVAVLVMQVVKKVKHASDTAQQAVQNVEAFTEQLRHAGRATAFGSILTQVTKAFRNAKKK